MKSNKMSVKELGSIVALVGAIATAGITYGALSTRVSALENRPDPTANMARLDTTLSYLSRDVGEVKRDVKTLLSRMR